MNKNYDYIGKPQTITIPDKSRKTTHADKYAEITAKIIAQLEQGIIPWRKPWSGDPDAARNYFSGTPYSLLNQMILMKSGYYATFKQWTEHGGKIRKGAKAEYVYFFKAQLKETDETDETGEKIVVSYPVLRCYGVFHESDVEGIEIDHTARPEPQKITDAEKIIADYVKNSGVKFTSKISAEAFYRPSTDEIIVPKISQFDETAEYYSTAFHEMTHSTGHKSRLNRDGIKKITAFGDENYSREELIAEMGAAYLCSAAGINSAATQKNSAAYLQSWIRALKNDKHMIVWAASRATKAADFILDMVENSENTDETAETVAPSENSASVSTAVPSAAETKAELKTLSIRHGSLCMDINVAEFFPATVKNLKKLLPEIVAGCSETDVKILITYLNDGEKNHIKNSEKFKDDAEMFADYSAWVLKYRENGGHLTDSETDYWHELKKAESKFNAEISKAQKFRRNAEMIRNAFAS